jgi:hypothetical protein
VVRKMTWHARSELAIYLLEIVGDGGMDSGATRDGGSGAENLLTILQGDSTADCS